MPAVVESEVMNNNIGHFQCAMSVNDDTPGAKNKNSANTQDNQQFEGFDGF